jgi:hypothetical protein
LNCRPGTTVHKKRWFKMQMIRSEAANTITLINCALDEPVGMAHLAEATRCLSDDLRRNRYSPARAVQLYTSSIDNAVWAYLESSPLKRIIYRNHLMSLNRLQEAEHLTDLFTRLMGVTDRSKGSPDHCLDQENETDRPNEELNRACLPGASDCRVGPATLQRMWRGMPG